LALAGARASRGVRGGGAASAAPEIQRREIGAVECCEAAGGAIAPDGKMEWDAIAGTEKWVTQITQIFWH